VKRRHNLRDKDIAGEDDIKMYFVKVWNKFDRRRKWSSGETLCTGQKTFGLLACREFLEGLSAYILSHREYSFMDLAAYLVG
jgi:hypothetical protein